MDFLILAPPVCPPTEPPAGAFVLASGLAARGHDAALFDLSLALYRRALVAPEGTTDAGALAYLTSPPGGAYEPMAHRTAAGSLHRRLKDHLERHPGWTLTLMDLKPPRHAHEPRALAALLAAEPHPFESLYDEVLAPVLAAERPRRVVVSLAYLSQLAGTIALVQWLRRHGIETLVGGSLPASLAATGTGLDLLDAACGPIALGDGMSLIAGAPREPLLARLSWPRVLDYERYMSARPIVPLPLSTGCYWRRCLFCPDRDMAFSPLSTRAVADFLESVPAGVRARRPVIHLIDSALPPAHLRRFLPLASQHGLSFYGFARPTSRLAAGGLLRSAAESGCLMLQLGVEGASGELLDRYDKGLDPAEAERVLREAAAHGIRTYAYMLFGLPGETAADRESTRRMLCECEASVDFLNLSVFNLPVHCELLERAPEMGIEAAALPAGESIRFYRSFTVGGHDPRREVRTFLTRLKADPRVRPALLRTPRWLRAAHLALMRLPGRSGP